MGVGAEDFLYGRAHGGYDAAGIARNAAGIAPRQSRVARLGVCHECGRALSQHTVTERRACRADARQRATEEANADASA